VNTFQIKKERKLDTKEGELGDERQKKRKARKAASCARC